MTEHQKSKKKLIVLAGPTAVGKTALAIQLAKHIGTEIISCDSRQIYKELNIGVARPSDEELSQIKHHFIATHSIHDEYDAGIYSKEVNNLLQELFQKYDTVINPYRKLNALNTVGYKEMFQYFDGEWTKAHAIEKMKQHTRNYAKRQLTWFRNQDGYTEVSANIDEILLRIKQEEY